MKSCSGSNDHPQASKSIKGRDMADAIAVVRLCIPLSKSMEAASAADFVACAVIPDAKFVIVFRFVLKFSASAKNAPKMQAGVVRPPEYEFAVENQNTYNFE